MKFLKYIIVIILIIIMTNDCNKNSVKIESKSQRIVIDTLSFSIDNLKYVLTELDVKHQDIVIKQFILETGRGTSYGFKKRNNLFGFYNKEYLVFDTWVDCCKYMKKWQQKRYSNGDYYKFLVDIKYAEDSLYISKLKHIYIYDI